MKTNTREKGDTMDNEKDRLIRRARAYERHLGIQPNDMRGIDYNDLERYVDGLREDYRIDAMARRIIKPVKK
jgi:hypothetical protein